MFDGTGQLRQGEHRHVHFLGENLESAGNFAHLVVGRFIGRHGTRLHELQVVHDDEALLALFQAMQLAAALGAGFQYREAWGVVDEHIQLGELARGFGQGTPVALGDEAAAQLREIHASLGAQDTLNQLLGAHLQREERHSGAGFSRVGGQVQCKGGFANTGARRQNNQIAAAKPVKQLIDVLEARGNAGHLVLLVGETGNFLVGVAYQLVHLAERRADAFLGYVEERLLRLFHHLIQIIGRVIGQSVNLRGGEHELAQNGLPLDNVDMALPAGEREGVVG